MALARTTSSSAVRRATLPISFRYIRTGSSIPIMSAESASSSSGVGSSSASTSSLTGASPATRGPTRTSSSHDLDTEIDRVVFEARPAARPPRLSARRSSSSSSGSSSAERRVRTPASLASSRSALRRPPPERATSTSCLSSGSVIGVLQRSSRWLAASPPSIERSASLVQVALRFEQSSDRLRCRRPLALPSARRR